MPAPRKPTPDTTWAAIRAGLLGSATVRDEGEQARARHHEAVRADAGGLVAHLALDADHRPEQQAQSDADEKFELVSREERVHRVCIANKIGVRL